MTRQEVRLWVKLRALRPLGLHFRRQVPIDAFVVDFARLKRKIVVEIDGSQHARERHAHADRDRDATLARLGFRVVRFWNNEIDADVVAVTEAILALCENGPHPVRPAAEPPSPAGRDA